VISAAGLAAAFFLGFAAARLFGKNPRAEPDAAPRPAEPPPPVSLPAPVLGAHSDFHLRLEEEVSRSHRYRLPVAVLFVGIDAFKRFNDAYGYAEGDRALAWIGTLLKENSREADLCARYGGDRFAAVLPVTAESEALSLAERLRSKVESAPLQVGSRSVPLSVSIGVAAYSGEERAPSKEELVRRASDALGRAKSSGLNRVSL
jgi:diguanylate cyclase (GGDEF)-like protein